jgi:hypothetical protein
MVSEQTPPPSERSIAAWRVWLQALAVDADAALSAAITYEGLAREARTAWLDALDTDLEGLGVPIVAAYAPLLAVEDDVDLRTRIEERLAAAGDAGIGELPAAERRGFVGAEHRERQLVVVASPLYLHFVELLVCRVVPDEAVVSATYEPLWDARNLRPRFELDGVTVEEQSIHDVVDLLAHAVLGDRRRGRPAPAELVRFADLFAVGLG